MLRLFFAVEARTTPVLDSPSLTTRTEAKRMHRIQKTISEVIDLKPPPSVTVEAPIAEAIDVMKSQHTTCVLVTDQSGMIGIFTERDFLNRIVLPRRSHQTPVGEVMTPDPEVLQTGDCITYAINKMVVGGFRNIPIVDQGTPVAVLRVRHIVQHLGDVFEEVETGDSSEAVDEWVDLGGG